MAKTKDTLNISVQAQVNVYFRFICQDGIQLIIQKMIKTNEENKTLQEYDNENINIQ